MEASCVGTDSADGRVVGLRDAVREPVLDRRLDLVSEPADGTGQLDEVLES